MRTFGLRFLPLLVVIPLVLMFTLPVAAETPLRVGVILPLSGPVAPMGVAFRRGFELFSREYPQAPVEFHFEDHRYDGKASLSAFHKLREVDAVDLSVVWGNMPGDTVAPLAERHKSPLFAVSMNPVAKDRLSVISLGPPMNRLIQKASDTFETWKVSTAAAVSIDIGNAIKSIEAMKEARQGQLLVTVVASEETDFKSIISNLKTKQVDGLFLLLLPDQALTFVKQASQMRFSPRIIGGDVFADEEFQLAVAPYAPDLAYVYGAVDQNFVERVRREFGSASYFFETACGYSVALLSSRAAELGPSARSRILDALTTADRTGIPLGGFEFSDTTEFGRHFVTDGKVYQRAGTAPQSR